ncbi:MAG TPA: aminoglycoside nucleotidyltransferase [Candidatus Dormibacteraeota bacterium]|nr:aminoglycoside nucleotidyltransferase [Candidatus Dormibacteraeota bacterium]
MTEKRAWPTQMTGRDAAEILGMVERLGVRIWIDGGWAVDALLGRQTRHHADLDIVIEQKDLDAVVGMFKTRGYRSAHRNNSHPWNFALGDGVRREVDLHVVVIDEQGNGICGPPANFDVYPAAALTGIGAIHGRIVRCVSHRMR